MILGREPLLSSSDLNLLPACMVRFQIPILISIGLKNTSWCLIFRGQNYFENDISVIYLTKFVFKIPVRFTNLLADVTQTLNQIIIQL